jgi:hypothetical protein
MSSKKIKSLAEFCLSHALIPANQGLSEYPAGAEYFFLGQPKGMPFKEDQFRHS